MFVRSRWRSAGIGRALLEALTPPPAGAYCTAGSTDPRAQALYIRSGMRPTWPSIHLAAPSSRLRLPASTVEAIQAPRLDPEFLRWDQRISRQERPADLAALGATLPAVPLWFTRAGKTIGYGYVQTSSEVVLAAPETFAIGPLGASTPGDALAATLAAFAWARDRSPRVRIALPGPHPAVGPLLEAGCRIAYVETFMSSSHEPLFDPELYCPIGLGLI
jgi:hypothetical protein